MLFSTLFVSFFIISLSKSVKLKNFTNKIVKYLLKPNDEPKAIFDYEKDSTIYAYCNKHGLWKKEI